MSDGRRTYVCNGTFDGNRVGEIITADPLTVQDWLDYGWISEVDSNGDRVFAAAAFPGGDPDGEVPDGGEDPES